MRSVEIPARVGLTRVGIMHHVELDCHPGKRRKGLHPLTSEDGIPILLENGQRMLAESRGNTKWPFMPQAQAAALLLEGSELMLQENGNIIKLENQ